jgi:polar amino acid transport system substrate-binding protein
MAVVLALTAVFALVLPLTQSRGDGSTGTGGQGVASGTQTKAEDCVNPQDQSLAPSGDENGETIQKIRERGKLRVGVDQNSYRWGYRDPNSALETSELEGFDIDLAHAIAAEILGDRDAIVFRAIPTNERIPAIQGDRVDMVVRTMTITCDRLEQVAFSSPYFQTGQQLLAPRTSDIKYDASLANKKICTAASSTALSTLTADKKSGKLVASADIKTVVPNQLDCLVRLQLGEVDAVVTDGALAASQAAQDPTVELKGEPFTTEYYGVAMKKGADDLVRRVNQVLVDYRENGWQQSYDKWLKPTIKKSAVPPPVKYQ